MRMIALGTFLMLQCAATYCYADDIPENQKCLPKIIVKIAGTFLPSPEKQILIAEQKQSAPPLQRNDIYCQITAVAAKYDSISHSFIPFWKWDMRGPGYVFTDGHWGANFAPIHIKLQSVQLLPQQYGALDQVLVYHYDEHVDGGWSYLRITAFQNEFAVEANLLDISERGSLNYSISGDVLNIRGYYIPNGACNACGTPRSVRLKFDPEVGQFAIVDPNKENEEFYHYLLIHKVDENQD